ncbi:iron-containing redox enzyme family protein [Actinocrinis puniceicyclus]|uniref:Iron-containing redox enzyme family protein n=1 Tax=Actinocrinis puniceicyclus TaxID=977794 RepID=A0A8J8BDE4_9ACTN|nr:iron-containing redox enzyme family protein [Actinocrinis puniceicyclus]MBS2965168.1 iron-containing redox enzyme family protein [Actinocrinis puniceicyclus]
MSASGADTTVPAATQDRTERPRLRHCTFKWTSDDSPMLMIVGKEYFEITEDFGTRAEFLTIKRYLDGRHTVEEISKRSGADIDSVRAIVETFDALGLLHDPKPLVAVPGESYADQIEASCDMWGRQIGYHRLYSGLDDGSLRSEVFLGIILETYHYVKSAPRHIATAIAHCDDDRLEPILSKYFTEEYNHAGMLLQALKRMGLPKEQIQRAHPVIGTWSLINNLCEVARRDTLSYIACTTLFEARADDFEGGAASLRKAARLAGFPEECAEPLITHMRIDLEAGHVGLLREAMNIVGSVPAEKAHKAVNNLHDIKHSYDQFHDQVIQYYSDIANYIPRLSVDYFSL